MSGRPNVDHVVAVAGGALSTAWGTEVTIQLQDPIRSDWGRHTLVRCEVDAGATDHPATVVVKAAAQRDGSIFNEWATLEWLRRLDEIAGSVPELYAGDIAAELIVIEDVGTGPLLRRMLHTRREWATQALFESMRLLGRIHAATRGRRADHQAVRGGLPPGPSPPVLSTEPAAILRELESWNPTSDSVRQEIASAAADLEADSGFTALTFHDACPPNRVITPTGVRAVDLEMAAFRHPMIDGVYGAIGHLRCNDGLAIPADVRREMTRTYAAAALAGYPEYRDAERFQLDLASGTLVWFAELLRRFRRAADRNATVGFFGVRARQRVHAAIDAFLDVASTTGRHPHVAAWATALRDDLNRTWGVVPPLPTFPGLLNQRRRRVPTTGA